MLATPGRLPGPDQQGRWAFEAKWDGMRVVAESRHDGWTLMGRSGRDVTSTFPDLGGDDGVAGLAAHLGDRAVIVDGEIVVVDDSGRPSFSLLQQRMNVSAPDPALVATVPVQLLVFDLLSLDGTDATGLAYADRRRLLEDLDLDAGSGGRVRVPPTLGDDSSVAWATAEALGLEGVVAKRLDAPYQPGRRSSAWVKVKRLMTQEVVVVGWAEGEGRRSGGVGALLLAVAGPGGAWRSVGRVGTGFTDRMLDQLAAELAEGASSAWSPRRPRRVRRRARSRRRSEGPAAASPVRSLAGC